MNDLEQWVASVTTELGLDVTVDQEVVLDLARDVAHAVARPATPLTTYLLGCAVGKGLDFETGVGRVSDLVARWPREQ
jgi:hypothetical protein